MCDRKNLHVAHDEVLVAGQKIGHHLDDDIDHPGRMKDALREREQEHNKWKQREDDLCRHAECVGMHLGFGHVVGERENLLQCSTFGHRHGRLRNQIERDLLLARFNRCSRGS